MDPGSWARAYTYARRYQSRSDMYRGDEYEGDEEQQPEFLCPFCAEDFDMLGLCCHIDEEHPVEATNGVCPVCARKVGSDLIRHMTSQHGSILKVQRRRRFRRGGSSNFSFSSLRKELRDGKLQSLLGGSSFLVPSSHDEPDPLLTSFMYNPPVVDEPPSVQSLSSIEVSPLAENTMEDLSERVVQESKLSEEDHREKVRKCECVQGLLLSTILDDDN